MSKKNQKKKKNKSNWTPPKGYKSYFYASSDEAFKAKHPIGYGFLVMLGFAGGFIFGIGLFNFVAIIIKQYLGHWVSIVSFLIGGAMMLISWFLCR